MNSMKPINDKNLIVIILLVIVTGLIIYYLYMKPEPFYYETTDPNPTPTPTPTPTPEIQPTPSFTCPSLTPTALPQSTFSRFFGIGFNIYPINSTTQTLSETNNIFLIEHIPVAYNNSMGSMYAISTDGQLTIKLKNEEDISQWWRFTKFTDSATPTITSTSPTSDKYKEYYVIRPYILLDANPEFALQYENGNLALRPFNPNNVFESQKWIFSDTKVKRGIPVLNYSPASLFTPEFDPYSTTTSVSSSSLSQQNNQQVNEVLNTVKASLQQYINSLNIRENNTISQVSASSLGTSDLPLNINLNLGSGVGGISSASTSTSGISKFDNITGTTTPNDVLSLLDRYESANNNNNSNLLLMNQSDLQTALNSAGGCSNINLNDFTSNRVSSCNCKL